jgi:dihydrofolate synthase/folylpolyglutamate synthase
VNYAGALAHLDRHINLEATGAGHVDGLSLEKMRELVAVAGDPQQAYPVIHITGTNGKGSVARMISTLLVEHGLSVGTYTSPHLERINERLAWNLESIDDESFAAVIEELAVLEPLLETTPSYFELLTAAAFSWFSEVAVDVAVVEVGMLGRYDATNVADAAVAVITNIGRDHTDGRGDWRTAVASEKVGIVKPASILVLGQHAPDLRPLYEAEGPAEILEIEDDFEPTTELAAFGGRLFGVRTPRDTYDDLYLPLYGSFQTTNAAVALVATEAFFARALDHDTVSQAFGAVTVPGRFEVVHRNPLVVIDGAHNPDGAQRTADTLQSEFDVAGRLILVVGFLRGREPVEMLEALRADRADLVIACTPDSARAIPAEDVAAAARSIPVVVEVARDITDAVDRAFAVATEEDAVVITGSLYVAGAARTALRDLIEDRDTSGVTDLTDLTDDPDELA